jgi:hypothetical protein
VVDVSCLRRIVDATWGLWSPGTEEFVLLHVPSGHVLTDGVESVRFASASEAAAFRVRYLGEAAAWKPIPAPSDSLAAGHRTGFAA